MYEDKKVSVNWFRIGLRIISVILIVLILFKIVELVKENRTNVIENDKMKEKLSLLEEAGKQYFTSELLPKTVGDSVTISLSELIKEELIEEIKDTNDRLCDSDKSNIKVTKLDSEYQVKSYLVCPNYEDYINSFIKIEDEHDDNKVTITPNDTTTTTTTTTKKVQTTKKKTRKYRISFNTNGGSYIKDQTIEANQVVISPGAPKRDGYTFAGWYYHGEPFDMQTKINQDYVLVAKWIKE